VLAPALPAGVLLVVWTAVGWAVGLALNHVAYQIPSDLSPISAPRCPACHARIPILRLVQRRCERCGAPLEYDRIEWITAVCFLLLGVHVGQTALLLVYSFYTAVLVLTAIMDMRHRYIYSLVSYPSIAAAMVLSPTVGGLDIATTGAGVATALAIFVAFYVGGRLAYPGREPVGKGDIELAAMIGAMTGFPRVVSALFLGSFVNGFVIALLLLTGRRRRMDFVPYGPGLCLGAYAALFMSP